jgi:hypothetical protein
VTDSREEMTGAKDKSDALRAILKQPSRLQRSYPEGLTAFSYRTADYQFRAKIEHMLVTKGVVSHRVPLEELHTRLQSGDMQVDGSQVNSVTEKFYTTTDGFYSTYTRFVSEVIAGRLLGCDVYFQATPTIRFHFPHARGMSETCRIHNDLMLGHPPQEINFWLPMTNSRESKSFALSTLSDTLPILADYDHDLRDVQERLAAPGPVYDRCLRACRPVSLMNGEGVAFDSRCLHTARRNKSGATRVSIDFRVVPTADLGLMPYEFRGTGRMRARFVPGGYYAVTPTGACL